MNNITIDENAIYFTDAINTRIQLIEYLDKHNLDYLLPVKSNYGNKVIKVEVEALLADESKLSDLKKTRKFNKTSGCSESREYIMIPADLIPSI